MFGTKFTGRRLNFLHTFSSLISLLIFRHPISHTLSHILLLILNLTLFVFHLSSFGYGIVSFLDHRLFLVITILELSSFFDLYFCFI